MKSTSILVFAKKRKINKHKNQFETPNLELHVDLIESSMDELDDDDDDFTFVRSRKGKKSKGIQMDRYGMITRQVIRGYQ
jgi:hypothetical protein